MSFEFNPAEEDPHGECRHEIHRLEAINADLLAACKAAMRIESLWCPVKGDTDDEAAALATMRAMLVAAIAKATKD